MRRSICWRPASPEPRSPRPSSRPKPCRSGSLPRAGRTGRAARARRDAISPSISTAYRLACAARGDGSGGRLFFVKIVPNGRRAADGFRWRRGGLRALCRDEDWSAILGGVGSRQRRRRGMVAGGRGVFVRGLRASAPGGRLMDGSIARPEQGDAAAAASGAPGAGGSPCGWRSLRRRFARQPRSPTAGGAAARNPDKLYLEADQLIYDKDHNTVTADRRRRALLQAPRVAGRQRRLRSRDQARATPRAAPSLPTRTATSPTRRGST